MAFKKTSLFTGVFFPLVKQKKSYQYLYALARMQDVLERINDHSNAPLLVTSKTDNRPSNILSWIAGRHELLISMYKKACQSGRCKNYLRLSMLGSCLPLFNEGNHFWASAHPSNASW